MDQWEQLAQVLDSAHGDARYSEALGKWRIACDDPEQTLSGQVLKASLASGHGCWASDLATEHRNALIEREYALISEQQLKDEVELSFRTQAQIELADKGSFDEFLMNYFGSRS
jgi:glutamate--cysteine ligase